MKKIYSFLTLAAALLCSGNAWAVTEVGTLSALQSAISAGGEIKLTENINCGTPAGNHFTISKMVTIDLNGKTLSGDGKSSGGSDISTFDIANGGSLTIKGTGIVDFTQTCNYGYIFKCQSGSTLNIQDNPTIKTGYQMFASTSGTKNITGGSFNKDMSSYIDKNNYQCVSEGGLYVVKALTPICTVDGVEYKTIAAAMTAAKVGGVITHHIVLTSDASYASSISENYIFDGTFTLTLTKGVTNGTYNCPVNVQAQISGGTYNNTVSTNSQLNGGIFNVEVNTTQYIGNGTYNYDVTTTKSILGGTFNAGASAGTDIYGGLFFQNPTGAIRNGYTKVENSGSTKYMVALAANVSEGKIVNGAYAKYYGVSEFADTQSHTVLTGNSFYDYVVLSDDVIEVGGTKQLNKGIYNFSMSSVMSDGQNCTSATISGTSWYFIGKNITSDGGLTGGTFNFNPATTSPLKEGEWNPINPSYEVVGPTDGKWTVQIKESAIVAKIGNVAYPSVTKALSAATANQTVVLQKDWVENVAYYNYNGKAFTLDLNGHKLSSESGITLHVQGNGSKTLTITSGVDGGTLEAQNGTALYVGSTNNYCKAYASINNCVVKGTTAINVNGKGSSYKAYITINGGSFEGNLVKNSNGSYTINSGTFDVNPATVSPTYPSGVSAVQVDVNMWIVGEVYFKISTGKCTNGSVLINGETGTISVPAGDTVDLTAVPDPDYKFVTFKANGVAIEGSTYIVKTNKVKITADFIAKDYVCQIGTDGAKFESIEEAVENAAAGDVINVLKSFTQTSKEGWENDGYITIDLNGYTITQSNKYKVGLMGNMTVKNGTIISGNGYGLETHQYAPADVAYTSNIVLDNLTMSGTGVGVYNMTNLVMKNMHITNNSYYPLYVDDFQDFDANITIESGEYIQLKNGGSSINMGGNKAHRIYIQGGSFNKQLVIGEGGNAKYVISGGLFNSNPDSTWLASNYQVIETSDPTYKYTVVKEGQVEEEIVVEQDDEQTITEEVATKEVKVKEEGTLTIQENASVTATDVVVVKEEAILQVEQGASLTTSTIALAATPANIDLEHDQAGTSSQITGDGAVQAPNAYIDITMNNSGTMNSKRYYAFAVPFNVAIVGGVEKVIGSTTSPATRGTDYRVYTYDGDQRATKGEGANWKKVGDATDGGYFIPGKFYLAEFADNSCNVFRFHKATDAKLNNMGNVTLDPNTSTTGEAGDGGWNGIANNALSNASVSVDEVQFAQVLKETGDGFYAVELNSTYFAISTPMFIKTTGATEAVVAKPSSSNAPARMLAQTNDKALGNYTIRIKADGATRMADQMFISANENATNAYTDGKDLAKMFLGTSSTAQLWVNNYGMKLTANQTVLTNDVAEASITLYAPTAGNYTVYLRNMADDADIYLLNNGQAVANLNNGSFTVTLAKGENTQYGLRINAKTIPGVFTSIDEALVGNGNVRKVLLNGNVYIIRDGKMFNALGQQL